MARGRKGKDESLFVSLFPSFSIFFFIYLHCSNDMLQIIENILIEMIY